MMIKKIILSLFLGFLASSYVFGNGYQVNLQGHRQTAMGNTGTGLAFDAASLFFNPGAMGFKNQNSLMLGVSGVNANVKYFGAGTATYGAESDPSIGTPFYAYFTKGISEKVTVGLGIFTPFGSTVKWGDQWAGRLSLDELSLAAIFVQPTVSYRINDKLSIGGGLDVVFGSVNLQRNASLRSNETGELIRTELDGKSDIGFGYNLGLFFQPIEMLSVGLNYRSKVDINITDGDFTSDAPAGLQALIPNTTFDASLPLPSVFTIGVGLKASTKLTLALDISMVGWSAYEELKFTFAEPVAGATETISKRNYENTLIFKVGAEYNMGKFALRGGAYYDQSPVPDGYMTPETPDSDSYALTGGFGWKLSEKFSLDTYFLFIHRDERKNVAVADAGNISGTYQARIVSGGVSFAFKL